MAARVFSVLSRASTNFKRPPVWIATKRVWFSDKKEIPTFIHIRMPEVSADLIERRITSWDKVVGDKIAVDEALCQIDTDQFSYAYTSEYEGYLAKILFEAGEHDIPPGTEIAIISPTKEGLSYLAAQHEAPHENCSVEEWLSKLPGDMRIYSEAFKNEGFDTMEAVKMLVKEDLVAMGVKKGHIRIIMASVEAIKDREQKEKNQVEQS